MQKLLSLPLFNSGQVTKTWLRVMKLIAIFLFTLSMHLSARVVSQTVTYTAKDVKLVQVFKIIKQQTGYVVLYNPVHVQDFSVSLISADKMPVKDFFEMILRESPFEFSIEDKNIIVAKRPVLNLSPKINTEAVPPIIGVVRDLTGAAINGVTVTNKVTKKSVQTNARGEFNIEAKEGNLLIFTSIGYAQKEIKVGVHNEIGVIQLTVSESKLDEVQIIAYGKTTQRLSTGNVTTVKADVIEKQPVNNPLLALQGRVPGLFIEQATGFAGTGVKVRIQGKNSLSNGNDPLYVIDGVPYYSQLLPSITGSNILGQPDGNGTGNPLSFINSNDIESIDVLKDADATSIYGSRAANGAILITTKKGKAGDVRVNLSIQSGIGQVARRLNLLNSQQYLEMRNEALRMDGIFTPSETAYDINGTWDAARNTDWQEELLGGDANYHDAQMSISGGNDNTQFLISGTFHKENTVFPGDFNDKKASGHFSLTNSSINKKFKLQFTGNYLLDDNFLPGGYDLTDAAIYLPPNAPQLYNNEGLINWAPNSDGISTFQNNPIAFLYNTYNNKTYNLISDLQLSYRVLNGLELKSNFSYNRLNTDEKYLIPSISTKPEDLAAGYNPRGGYYGANSRNTWVVEPQITFTRQLGYGRLESLIGSTFQQNRNISEQLFGYGYSSDQMIDNLKAATQVYVTSTLNSTYKYNALFGRINYNLDNKYIASFNLRRDGSSRFGPKSQFHNFWSVAFSWIFSNENLVKAGIPFLSFGKLSGSYGTTGSDQISDYQFLSLYDPVSAEDNYQGTIGLTPVGLTNPYLQWEETRKSQVSLDLGFFKDRILFKSTYFNNRSSNHLLNYKLPIFAGFTEILQNFPATIQNSGLELSISSQNISSKHFKWSSSFNLTVSKNKLVDFPNLSTSNYVSSLIIGQPITLIKQFHLMGVNPADGVYMFADQNGNPTVNPKNVSGALNNDKYIIGYPDPKFYGGFQNSLNYKGIELSIFFQFVKQMGRDFSLGSAPGSPRNQPISVLNRWQKPGDIAVIQRYNSNYSLFSSANNAIFQSDATWSDASYVRLKNLSISWELPQSWTSNVYINNCRLFVQGQNLLTITSYNGLDPETKSSNTLPPLRVVTAGIKIGL